MANKIAESTLVLTLDDAEVQKGLARLPKDAAKAAKDIEQINFFAKFAAFKEVANGVSAALGSVVGGFVELGTRGAAVDDVASSFQILAEKSGAVADVMLNEMRQGVVGSLSDFDLMKLANRALGSGLVKTSEDMGVLAAGARTLAKATGEDTASAFDTLTSAMASGRTAQLKQLGIFVDSKVAIEGYAASIGKSVSDLTDADRAQALAGASLAALRQRMKEIVPDAADFGELIDQGKTKLTNFRDALSVAVAKSPAFKAGMEAMGKALDSAFGLNQASLVGGLTGLMEGLAIGVLNIGHGAVGVGHVFATVFAAIETIVNGVLTAIVGAGAGIVTVVDSMARLQAALPFASDGAKELAAMTGALKTRMDAMTTSLAASTAEAAKGVIGQGALHDQLRAASGIIFGVQYAIENATAATGGLAKAQKDQADGAGVASVKNKEAAEQIAAAFRDLNAEIVGGTKVGLEKRLFEIDAARQKELAGLSKFKFESEAQRAEMVRLTNEKYAQQTMAAILAGDAVVAKEREVQQAIALQLTAGTANKVMQLEIARDKEIEALAFLKASNEARYNEDVAAVNEKYRLQIEAAKGYFASVELAAAAAGFKTKAELQSEADNALRLYNQMKSAGIYTQEALTAAHKAATDAQMKADGEKALNAKEKFELIKSSAFDALRSIFGKNKAAAISMAIVDTAAAVVSSFKNAGGFPWGLVPAAAMAAAGAAQISTIRSQDAGFAQGTPGLDFADFGAMSWQPLHNQEAVIPRGGGHLLAGEIADSMPGGDEQLSLLSRIAAAQEELPREIRKAFRNAMILDRP